jgi:soluble lytic murein transglycosylase
MDVNTLLKAFVLSGMSIAGFAGAQSVNALDIGLLINNHKIAIPTARPDYRFTGAIQAKPLDISLVSSGQKNHASPINGSLKQGLEALRKSDVTRALGIRAGMPPGSLDRKILAWSIAVSGKKGIRSGEISSIARDLAHWPGQKTMSRNAERALSRENLAPSRIISLFRNRKPVTVDGAILLSRAYLQSGQSTKANRIIAPFWRNETLDKKTETEILNKVGSVLTQADHRQRMHKLLYNDRISAAERIANKTGQFSLAKARSAVIRKENNAGRLLESVAASSKRDVGYLFARIEHARRSGNYTKAANLLLQAPRDQNLLIDPDEWWVERRVVSREMLELGKPKLAYRIASQHSAKSASDIIDAEFHSGWYALRFLNDATTARRHFLRLLEHATRPISQARGHYWLARASKGENATAHYRKAAHHAGTYYGQLAAMKLGVKKLSIKRAKPTTDDRNRYKSRELVRAIKRLEGIGSGWRADGLYRHLALMLKSPGEIAILSADAERKGNYSLALQVGKLAHGRGLQVDTLSWPLGAIPSSARIGNTGRALSYSIARQESAFNKRAVSPANARGLLQLLPGTAKQVARSKGMSYSYKRLTSDAGYNATLGATYLSQQLSKFNNSYILTFAGYNAGPRKVDEWIERFGDPRGKPLYQVIDWVEKIPYKETRSYVQRILENYQVYKTRISGSSLNIENDLRRGRR